MALLQGAPSHCRLQGAPFTNCIVNDKWGRAAVLPLTSRELAVLLELVLNNPDPQFPSPPGPRGPEQRMGAGHFTVDEVNILNGYSIAV